MPKNAGVLLNSSLMFQPYTGMPAEARSGAPPPNPGAATPTTASGSDASSSWVTAWVFRSWSSKPSLTSWRPKMPPFWLIIS